MPALADVPASVHIRRQDEVASLRAELARQAAYAASLERENDRLRELVVGPWVRGSEHYLRRANAAGGQMVHLSMDCQHCDEHDLRNGCSVCTALRVAGEMVRVAVEKERAVRE